MITTAWLSQLVATEDKEAAMARCADLKDLAQRERAYRTWCRYHRESVLRSDLTRLKEATGGTQQRPLFD